MVLLAFLLAAASATARAGQPQTAEQIVEQMQQHNRLRTEHLERYRTVRHYQVEYQGFSKHLVAEMAVEVSYDRRSGKSFRILSQSGSHALCEKVLRKAVETEQEAADDPAATALSLANYSFMLLGSDSVDGRPAYVLQVEPRTGNRFLYRGKVWVDAADYAVAKMEAQPAKNPSFWISRTIIHQRSVREGEFWLPGRNQSETHVRVGGTAVFTIDFGDYQLQTTGEALASAAQPGPARH
jgi:hypothetical protein